MGTSNLSHKLLSCLRLLGIILSPPGDVLEERDALLRDDFVTYSALNGMEFRHYDVETPDGWVLQIWRIWSPGIFHPELSAPVLLSHGHGSSGFTFMMNPRNSSIAFILADNGYNVFLANYRCNRYSNKKSWQDMAKYDFPTMVDFVLNETNQSKIYLNGNSMGNTIPIAFLSRNHSYNDKISHLAAVVPVLKLGYEISMYHRAILPLLSLLAHSLPQTLFEFVFATQQATAFSLLRSSVCTLAPPLCWLDDSIAENRYLLNKIVSNPHINQTRAAIYSAKDSGGGVLFTSYNFAIELGRSSWTDIDYSKIPQTNLTNEGVYGKVEPDSHNFENMKVPISMYFLKSDSLIGQDTAKIVANRLNATKVKFIDGNGLKHSDMSHALNISCYTLKHFMSDFNRLEAERGDERREYRRKAAEFARG